MMTMFINHDLLTLVENGEVWCLYYKVGFLKIVWGNKHKSI